MMDYSVTWLLLAKVTVGVFHAFQWRIIMSDDVQGNLVGYLSPAQVDMLRTEVLNDGDGTLGILDQLVFQAPDGTMCKLNDFRDACVQAGMAGVIGVVTSAAATTVGGIVLGTIGTLVALPAALTSAAASLLAGAKKVSVTIVVVNTTDHAIEMVEDAYNNHGKLASLPVVRDANDTVLPPNRASGTIGEAATNWIDSATNKGMPAGSGAVGVWRFIEDRTWGVSFVGLGATIRLKNVDEDYQLYIGAESGYRSFFTSNDKNSVAVYYEQGSYSGSSEDYFEKHVTGKAYKTGGLKDTLKSNHNITVQAAGNGAEPPSLVATVIIS